MASAVGGSRARVVPWAVSLALASVVVAVALLKYGIGSFPQWVTLYDIGTHWMDPRRGAHLDAGNDYLLTNALAAVVAGAIGLVRSRESYGAVMLALTLAAVAWPFGMPRIRQSPTRAAMVFILLLGGPVVAVLMLWVGGYDPVTVVAAALVGLGRARSTRVAGWILFGANHYNMAAIALVLYAAVVLLDGRRSALRKRIVDIGWCAGGALAGALMSLAAVTAWGGASTRTSSIAMPVRSEEFWGHYASMLPAIALSALGVAWILFLHLAWRGSRPAVLALGAGVAAAFVVPFAGYDATRDIGLTVLPSLLALAVSVPDPRAVLGRWPWLIYAGAAVVAPTLLVFGWQASWVGWGIGG